MIGLSSIAFDPIGAVYIYQDQIDQSTIGGMFDRQRRTTKYRTLDGGVVIVDAGHSHGDRALAVTINRATSEQVEAITRLVEKYSALLLTTPGGCFRVSPESCAGDGSSIKINLSFISEA
ncbi:MAG: hypothetical protein ACLGQH_09750 [Acidobacteriota bacterium]